MKKIQQSTSRIKKEFKMHLPNPYKQHPKVSEKAWISETAVIIGNVNIEDDVFVGPNAVLRADEPGSSITVHSGSNVQDNVIVHALSHSEVLIGKKIPPLLTAVSYTAPAG